MNIDTGKLKILLKKATLNFLFDSVQLNFTKDSVKSKMTSSMAEAITILNMPNEILPEMKSTDIITMNFSEPSTNVMPHLNLIDDNEDTKIDIRDEKITLIQNKQKSNIFYCAPQIVSTFEGEGPRGDVDYFKSIPLDDDFMNEFTKIKKIGSKFNKIYFGIESNVLYIEASDKQNRYSNGLRIDLCDVVKPNLAMYFDFKNMVNLMSVINDGVSNFTCKFAYVNEQALGMLNVSNEDNSENYYLMSKIDQ